MEEALPGILRTTSNDTLGAFTSYLVNISADDSRCGAIVVSS